MNKLEKLEQDYKRYHDEHTQRTKEFEDYVEGVELIKEVVYPNGAPAEFYRDALHKVICLGMNRRDAFNKCMAAFELYMIELKKG